eukprot:tig00021116_g18403.t1
MSLPSELVEDFAKACDLHKSGLWPTPAMEKRARKLGYLYQTYNSSLQLNFVPAILPKSKQPKPEPKPEPPVDPADDAKSEASDAESDINDFIDFDVPIPYDSESSSDSEGDNENPTRKRRIIKTKSIVKKKFMETTSFTDNSERVKDPAKENAKDLKLGAGIARSRVTSHYTSA